MINNKLDSVSHVPTKFKGFWLELEELFDILVFKKYIIKFLDVRTQYQILIKIRYNVDEFAMLGQQFLFKYDNYLDDFSFYSFRDIISNRLNIALDNYGISEPDVVLIHVEYRVVFYGELEKLKIEGIKHTISKNEYAKIRNISPYFPLSNDLTEYGKPLKAVMSNNIVKSVLFLTNKDNMGEYLDFIEIFNKNNTLLPSKVKPTPFHSKQLFFQRRVKGGDIILVIDIINTSKYIKKAYSLSGVFLGEVEDFNIDNNLLKRKFGNYTFFIKQNSIIFSEKKNYLTAIKKKSFVDNNAIIEDIRIGVIDLETYTVNINGVKLAKVYTIGFFTNLNFKPVLYYIDIETLNSEKIVLKCIDEMLRPKYRGITFYAHNSGMFDNVFILKILSEFNKQVTNNPYIIKTVCRDNIILKLTIQRKIDGVLQSVSILDSYRILTDKLSVLCTKYEVEESKGYFPYDFATVNNLSYIGETPNKNYYDSSMTLKEYNDIKKDVWNFKEESLSYLSKDLIGLYQVLKKVNRTLFLDFNIKMSNCLTVSKMSYVIFTKDYLSADKPIPLINKKAIYRDIKLGYYGGITEVYKPYGENLYYYDVNSLYPYVSLNDMVGLECHKQEYINKKANLNELFGFFYCDIEAPLNKYLGILPVRTNAGIIFPVGRWSGMYFSEELKYAVENGYVINIKWGYKFNRVSDLFTKYVENLYKMKSYPKNITQKNLAKSLLNNLIGRFGLDINKPITEIVDSKTFNEISLTRKITAQNKITDDSFLVTYIPELDESICESFNIDFIKALKSFKESKQNNTFDGVSIPIAAATTAYGRIHITKIKNKILEMGGNIYYSDTDSIVTDLELPTNMVDSKILGKLKLEHKVVRGYFISAKTYCLINTKGDEIKKAKGLKSTTLKEADYIDLYKGNNIKTGEKTYSTTNYYEGSVVISNKYITLNTNSYTKRTKIYKDKNWIDTKPLIYNINNSCVTNQNNQNSIT